MYYTKSSHYQSRGHYRLYCHELIVNQHWYRPSEILREKMYGTDIDCNRDIDYLEDSILLFLCISRLQCLCIKYMATPILYCYKHS